MFDSKGRLIGITTFTIDNAQRLNFAMPAEDIEGLQRQSKKVTAAAWIALGDEIMEQTWRQSLTTVPIAPAQIGNQRATRQWGQELQDSIIPLRIQWRRASHAYEEALGIDQNASYTWVKLADVYSRLDEQGKAVSALNRAKMLAPGDVNVWVGVGEVERKLGDDDAVIYAYNRALAIAPNDPSILLEVARSYSRSDKKKSLQTLDKIAALRPKDGMAWWRVGLAYQLLDKNKLAEAAFQQAIGLDARNPIFWLSLGQLYALEGKRSKFSEVYTHLKTLDPTTAAALARSMP